MKPRYAGTTMLVTLLSCGLHPSLQAQLGVEGLGSSVTDVSFFASCWTARPNSGISTGTCPNAKNGLGVETSFYIGRIRISGRFFQKHGPRADSIARAQREERKQEDERRRAERDEIRRHGPQADSLLRAIEARDDSARAAAAIADTVTKLTLQERRIRRGRTVDVYRAEKGTPRDPRAYFTLEFALGYSQYSGFQSTNPDVDLRGAVRELPSASIYATLITDSRAHRTFRLPYTIIEPYVGLRTGFLQLEGVQASRRPGGTIPDSAAVFVGTGRSIEVGALAGLVLDFRHFYLYGDAGYMFRRLPSIQWKSDASKFIPSAIPLSLDFSGWNYTVGIQVPVKTR